jgi:hypothetical protein
MSTPVMQALAQPCLPALDVDEFGDTARAAFEHAVAAFFDGAGLAGEGVGALFGLLELAGGFGAGHFVVAGNLMIG